MKNVAKQVRVMVWYFRANNESTFKVKKLTYFSPKIWKVMKSTGTCWTSISYCILLRDVKLTSKSTPTKLVPSSFIPLFHERANTFKFFRVSSTRVLKYMYSVKNSWISTNRSTLICISRDQRWRSDPTYY